jgi:hypothetical protein
MKAMSGTCSFVWISARIAISKTSSREILTVIVTLILNKGTAFMLGMAIHSYIRIPINPLKMEKSSE